MTTTVVPAPTDVAFDRDSGRARLPDRSGFAVAEDGVRLAFDVYGAGDPTIVLLPSAPIVHSRQWKAQVHYLSRHWRVVTYDGRGNGRSDRPTRPGRLRRRADGRRPRRRHGCDGHGSCRARRVVHRRRVAIDPVRRREPGARPGHRRVRHRRPAARAAAAALRGGVRDVRRRAADDRRLGEAQPPLLAARLSPTTPGSSSARSAPSRTRRRRSRTRPAGRWTPRSR